MFRMFRVQPVFQPVLQYAAGPLRDFRAGHHAVEGM
jgi:hypothetical protein